MKTKILKHSIFFFAFLVLLLCFNDCAYAAKIGRANWVKSGNIVRADLTGQAAQQVNAQAAASASVQPEANIGYLRKYSFKAPKCERTDKYDKIHVPGLEEWGNAGAPILPVKPVQLLIPYGQKLVGVRVQLGPKTDLSGKYTLEHAQYPVPLSRTDKPEPTPQDPAIYGSDNIYPEVPCGDVFVQKKHGYSILIVNLFPVTYQPVSGKISYYQDMTVQLEVTAQTAIDVTQAKTQRISLDPKRIADIRPLVENPEVLQSYQESSDLKQQALSASSTSTEQYLYIIITNQALRSSFQPLIDSKVARGIGATIVTKEDIEANYEGRDVQEKIRNCIMDYYDNYGTRYVLLGGDKGVIPPRDFWVESWPDGYVDEMPSDMYYSCLDPDCTFDGNGNGLYGEPTDGPNGADVDLYAEVFVGRAPVTAPYEVQNFVNKTLDYEGTTDEYLRTVYMLGEHLGFSGVSEYATDSLEQIRLGSDADGYTTIGFEDSPYANFFETPYLYESPNESWTSSQLMEIMNTGAHIFNHLGHANQYINMQIFVGELDSLENTDYFFVYSQGCLSGAFDVTDCFAEHITTIEAGAFAVIMNARYGWGETDSTDGPSQRYNREFWHAYLGENYSKISVMNQYSKERNIYRINESCMRWCSYELNLFGDPELTLIPNPGNRGILASRAAVSEMTGDGDGFFDPGESARIVIELTAIDSDFHNVSAVLTCEDEFVSIEDDSSTFGLINFGQMVDNQGDPFVFAIDPECPRGHIFNFEVTITSTEATLTRRVPVKVFSPWPVQVQDVAFTYNKYETAVADIDGDGKIEILTNAGSKGVLCLTTEGIYKWVYKLCKDFYAGYVPVIADVIENGTGNLEILSYASYEEPGNDHWDASLQCLDKDGNLLWRYVLEGGGIVTDPVAADINNDGNPEILFASQVYIYCLDGNGNELWRFMPMNTIGDTTCSLTLADLDQDGNLEILFTTLDSICAPQYDESRLYCLNKDGQELWQRYYRSGGSSPAVADINADNQLEIILVAEKLYCLDNNGDELWNYSASYSGSVVIADIVENGAGNLEIVAGRPIWGISCIDNTGGLCWKTYLANCQPRGSPPVAVDLDQDGNIEILAVSAKIYGNDVRSEGVINCIDSQGAKLWSVEVLGNIVSSVSLADLDGDGNVEMLFGTDEGMLYCLDKDGQNFFPHEPSLPILDPLPWPMFHCNFWHTGFYKLPVPSIDSIEPIITSRGSLITITGNNFGYGQGNSRVEFTNGAAASEIESWSNTEIICVVPQDAVSGPIKVVTKGGESNAIDITIRVPMLLAYYPFEGNANDASGNGHNGTPLGGPKVAAGIKGNAYEFDGVNDWIGISGARGLERNDEITVSAWVKTSEQYKDLMGIIKRGAPTKNWTDQEYLLGLRYGYGLVAMGDGQVGNSVIFNSSGPHAADGKWHMITATLKENIMKLYVDGKLHGECETHFTGAPSIAIQSIGTTLQSNFFKGAIDEVKIWNYALSEDDIEYEYVTVKQSTPNLIPNPNMEEGSTAPTYWSTYKNDLTNQTGWVTEASRSLTHSIKVVNTTRANAGWTGNYINIANGYPGNTFTFGGWAKTQDVELGALCALDFKVTFADGTYIWYYPQDIRFTTGTHDWEHKTITKTFEKKVVSIKPYCLLYYKKGTVWFDDIYVYMGE
jgi:hypothetical protein